MLNITYEEVEELLINLINDDKINGFINQISGSLDINQEYNYFFN